MNDFLAHYGVKGMRWGVRKSDRTVFVSGSSKTQSKDSGYYRKKLPKDIQKALKQYMKEDVKIIVGDAPGIDRQVQDFLKKRHYKNVEVYGPGKQVRYSANKKWKTNPIDAPEFEPGSKEWLAKKDIAMEKAATEGLAVVLDEGAKATRKNVERLIANNKDVKVYQINKTGKDEWVKHSEADQDELYHHGVKGQKWGVRRYQNPDGTLTAAGKKHRSEPKRYKVNNNIGGKFYYKEIKNGKMLSRNPKDYVLVKGSDFFRYTKTPNEVFKDRLYVSMDAGEYLNDYFADSLSTKYVSYTNDKDLLIAGRKSVNNILKKIGEKMLPKSAYNHSKVYIDPDFMFTDSESRKKFIEEAKKQGYSGMPDPTDSNMGIGFGPGALIFFDDVLRKTRETDAF